MSRTEDERKIVAAEIRALLEPLGFKVSLVTPLLGGWNIIWYWGKETSFAGGATAEAVARSAERHVFGGL